MVNEQIESDRKQLKSIVSQLKPDDRVWITARQLPTTNGNKARLITIHIEKNASLVGEPIPPSIDLDSEEYWEPGDSDI